MIAVDTNILVYAHRPDSALHDRAGETVRALAEGSDAWAIPWPCVHEFLAVVTHPRVWKSPTPMGVALGALAAWQASPKLFFLTEDDAYAPVLETVLKESRVQGPKVHDARIAALAIHHGIDVLYTADRDFSRFPRLKTKNPLSSS
jgi:toxin-antitoxin system PIN domain toxin